MINAWKAFGAKKAWTSIVLHTANLMDNEPDRHAGFVSKTKGSARDGFRLLRYPYISGIHAANTEFKYHVVSPMHTAYG